MAVRFVAAAGSDCRAAILARFQTYFGLSEVVEGVRIIALKHPSGKPNDLRLRYNLLAVR